MYSMTGYGKGVSERDGRKVTVEIKSVNHRYLDLNFKIPKNFNFFEDSLKRRVSERISRGHLELFLTQEQTVSDDGSFYFDVALAKNFLRATDAAYEELGKEFGIVNDITLGYLAKLPDMVTKKSEVDDEELNKQLAEMALEALDAAIEQLVAMRKREGEALQSDISQKLDNIKASLDKISRWAPAVVQAYRNGLKARIEGILDPSKMDMQRLATEVALFADHCAIDEEITRLKAHIYSMRKLLTLDEPVGRRMDFLVQEFNREANTIGSKANDLNITNEVLKIKNEIEKMREQAANIE